MRNMVFDHKSMDQNCDLYCDRNISLKTMKRVLEYMDLHIMVI